MRDYILYFIIIRNLYFIRHFGKFAERRSGEEKNNMASRYVHRGFFPFHCEYKNVHICWRICYMHARVHVHNSANRIHHIHPYVKLNVLDYAKWRTDHGRTLLYEVTSLFTFQFCNVLDCSVALAVG